MPSFDIVSEVDLQEVRNAVDQATRELRNRFDFRGVDASIELEDEQIMVIAPEEFQIKQLRDILRDKLVSRSVDVRSLKSGDIEGAGKVKRQAVGLVQGIDRDTAKKLTKLIKDSKLKVQAQVNGDKLRVTGKKRDDLQSAMAAVREADLETPFQFENFRD
ncbi:MAG: YajQ family cyclic di-GMP-binding protein [Pseudomonadota bacterium]